MGFQQLSRRGGGGKSSCHLSCLQGCRSYNAEIIFLDKHGNILLTRSAVAHVNSRADQLRMRQHVISVAIDTHSTGIAKIQWEALESSASVLAQNGLLECSASFVRAGLLLRPLQYA